MIAITKRFQFDHLDAPFNQGYAILRLMSVKDYESHLADINKFKADPTNEEQASNFTVKVIQQNFVKGEFPDADGNLVPYTKDQIADFDPHSLNLMLNVLMGTPDPKAQSDSPTTS